MLVVDNSEQSRNGDYTPTRWEAQKDAVSTVFSRITQSNPESSAGLVSMAGKGPEVLSTLTTDLGKILEGIHRTKIAGEAHLATAIQIAGVSNHLPALKGRNHLTMNSLHSSIARTRPRSSASLSSPARRSQKMRRPSSSSPRR